MDIASVQVSNTLTDITFKINLNGSIGSPNDWGKYLVGIDTGAGGDTGSPVGNPWGRNIRMPGGTDAFIGSWADGGGGFQPWTFAGGAWVQNGSGAPVLAGSSTTITTSLASLGLSPGQTINFDVWTSGGNGGDSANDALSNPNQSTTGWGGPYDTGTQVSTYTLAVPEPTTIALLAPATLALMRRRAR